MNDARLKEMPKRAFSLGIASLGMRLLERSDDGSEIRGT